MSVVMVALAALCSTQPVDADGSAPGQPDSSVNLRFTRDIISHECRCPPGRVPLRSMCVTCERYMDLTGDDNCPGCDKHGDEISTSQTAF